MLSENLKNLRMKRGLSQEELAEKVNVVRQTVSKWEKGLSVPDSELLIRLADVLGVSVGQLLGETIAPDTEKSQLQAISEKLENLNAMMAERNARSRKLMQVAAWCMLCAAVVCALAELVPLVITAVLLGKFAGMEDVGIIGGADGPTAIFLTGPDWQSLMIAGVICTALIAMAVALLRKAKR